MSLTLLKPGDRVRVNAPHLGREYIDKIATVAVCPLGGSGNTSKGEFAYEALHDGVMTTFIFVVPDEKRWFTSRDTDEGYWVKADCVQKIFPDWVVAAADALMGTNTADVPIDCTPEFEPDVDAMLDDLSALVGSLRDNGFTVNVSYTHPPIIIPGREYTL